MPGPPISGPCADDIHEWCNWPVEPAFILYCSCECHQEARAMPTAEKKTDAAEAQEIEAAAEPDSPHVPVPLAGYDGVTKEVRTLPAGRWRSSALRALNGGDMDEFMALVLHDDDYDIYLDLDPDMDAIGHFAEAAARAGGEDLGKSSGPRRSSSSSRKR